MFFEDFPVIPGWVIRENDSIYFQMNNMHTHTVLLPITELHGTHMYAGTTDFLRETNLLIILWIFTVPSHPITEECMFSPHMSNWQPDYITEHELQNCDRKNYKNHGSLLRPEESSLTRPWLRFRKLPGRNVYAQMHNEKEQEMTSPVNHSEDTQNIIQSEEFIDDDLDSQTLGNAGGRRKFSYPRLTNHY